MRKTLHMYSQTGTVRRPSCRLTSFTLNSVTIRFWLMQKQVPDIKAASPAPPQT
jgi:hypothetical protein